MDYLLRDGERMRLPYPRGIDVDRILKSLTVVVIDKVPGGARDVPIVGVHAKGKVAAEFVSIARYATFSQGYWLPHRSIDEGDAGSGYTGPRCSTNR